MGQFTTSLSDLPERHRSGFFTITDINTVVPFMGTARNACR